MDSPSHELLELRRIVLEAGRVAREERKSCTRELKPDGSIVTSADRAVETFLRKELTAGWPGSTVWGEEFGFEEEGPGGLWLVDPIDGTSNFCYGSPLWGVTVALMKGSDVALGAISIPDIGEDYIGEEGVAHLNLEPMKPIPAGPIRSEELVSVCEGILRTVGLDAVPGKPRCAGAFIVDAMWVATQRYRGLIGVREKLYDVAASVLICRNLGAEVRYLDGSPFDLAELKRDVKIAKPWTIFPRL